MSAKKKNNFEESLSGLEDLVSKLESGEFGLEQSLAHFEKGVELYKNCKEELLKAEKKLSELTEALKEEKLEFPDS